MKEVVSAIMQDSQVHLGDIVWYPLFIMSEASHGFPPDQGSNEAFHENLENTMPLGADPSEEVLVDILAISPPPPPSSPIQPLNKNA